MAKNNAIDVVIETGGGNTYTFPSATSTLATLDLAETLRNKDLSDASNTLGSANVTAAGALMDSELTSIADVKALDQSVVSGAAPVFDGTNFTNIPAGTVDVVSNVATARILGRTTAGSGDSEELTASATRTFLNVEDDADKTDTANVEAAGALMDSEVTNLSQVKAFDSTDYAAALGADDNYVTDAEKTVIGNTSGTNTGDEVDMTATEGGLVPTPPNNTSTFLRGDGTFAAPAGGSSSGTVTSVSVTTANGVSGSVADDSTTPAISLTLGDITPSTVNGLEVSLGGGSLDANVAVGTRSLESNTTGEYNTANGRRALSANTTGEKNTANGMQSLNSNDTGSFNTAYGYLSLFANTTGDGNVALGNNAGRYETGSNAFYVNNVRQSNTTNDRAYSLLYGQFSGTAGSLTGQQLTVNGDFTVNGDAAADNLSGTNTGDQDLSGLAPKASPTFTGTVAGITATMVGLGNVDNTSNATERAATATLENKRINKRTSTTTSTTTLTPSPANYDVYTLTAQAAALTIANPTGTINIGDTIAIYVYTAAAQTLTFGNYYEAYGAALPTTTTAGKKMLITLQADTATTLSVLSAVQQ